MINAFEFKASYESSVWYEPYLYELVQLKALSTSLLHPAQKITRDEMAEIMYCIFQEVEDTPFQDFKNIFGVFGSDDEFVMTAEDCFEDEWFSKIEQICLPLNCDLINECLDYYFVELEDCVTGEEYDPEKKSVISSVIQRKSVRRKKLRLRHN